jgi:hypothetical protein
VQYEHTLDLFVDPEIFYFPRHLQLLHEIFYFDRLESRQHCGPHHSASESDAGTTVTFFQIHALAAELACARKHVRDRIR